MPHLWYHVAFGDGLFPSSLAPHPRSDFTSPGGHRLPPTAEKWPLLVGNNPARTCSALCPLRWHMHNLISPHLVWMPTTHAPIRAVICASRDASLRLWSAVCGSVICAYPVSPTYMRLEARRVAASRSRGGAAAPVVQAACRPPPTEEGRAGRAGRQGGQAPENLPQPPF